MRNFLLAPIVALFYWLWAHTWRLKILEAPEFVESLHNGRVIFAHWHGHELVMVSVGPRYHCAAITSTSQDGDLMDRVLHILGYRTSRGSSTRGGARAIIGMLALMKEGYNATVAVDGPKGPIHKVKPGVWALAKHSGAPIITIGVAKKSGFVFNKSWNKAFLPWPFTKVVVSFGKPLLYDQNESEAMMCEKLEKALHEETQFAEKKLLAVGIALVCTLLFSGCATTVGSPEGAPGSLESFMQSPQRTHLHPVGKSISGNEPPIITYVMPNSRAAKYGFKVGDRILSLNGREIKNFVEFERKIKNIPSQVQVEVKNHKDVLTKNVLLSEERNRFGASTEPQNLPYVKKTSPALATLNRGPVMTTASASVDSEKKNLFVTFVVDSKVPMAAQHGTVSLFDKKTRKLITSSSERVDALGTNAVLIAKKFPLDFQISGGMYARLSLGKQHFTFEFQE